MSEARERAARVTVAANEQLRQIDTLLMPYRTEGAPTQHIVGLLEHVLAMLQKGKGAGG